ncbi:GlxA family transcriptional regulator [Vibrio breoganii]|uniref:GlxA family transcriptional regulator n=1 Tax=Vibrio breoganii TaxID=553239 RepID=UPI0003055D7F|nr:helix-turn-helix domain-containing protein [Vibrio breoganii]
MKQYSVALIALDNISSFHLSVPCLVFQDVFINQVPVFNLTLCSEGAVDVSLSSGFTASIDHDLSVIENADIVIVPSWPNTLPEPSQDLLDKLKQADERGATIVGLCLGVYAVAKAGLLDDKRATTHWAFSNKFQQAFPRVDIDCEPLFIEQANVITSAGTAASLDCCLHIVRRLCGNDIASNIARVMVTAPFRSGGQQQYIPSPIDKHTDSEVSFVLVINDIAQNLGQSYDLDSVAARCAMSRRTFTRQFKAQYGCTFGEWLTQQRLAFSQQLLESTDYSISSVAELSGIGSDSVFRKHFKKSFNVSPTQWRTIFRGNR